MIEINKPTIEALDLTADGTGFFATVFLAVTSFFTSGLCNYIN